MVRAPWTGGSWTPSQVLWEQRRALADLWQLSDEGGSLLPAPLRAPVQVGHDQARLY